MTTPNEPRASGSNQYGRAMTPRALPWPRAVLEIIEVTTAEIP